MSNLSMRTKQTVTNIGFRAHARYNSVFNRRSDQKATDIIVNGETEHFTMTATLTVDEAARLALKLLQSIDDLCMDVNEHDAADLRMVVDNVTEAYNLTNA